MHSRGKRPADLLARIHSYLTCALLIPRIYAPHSFHRVTHFLSLWHSLIIQPSYHPSPSKSLKPFSFPLFINQVTMVAPKSKDATPSGSKPTRGWDAAAHEALLLCVIDEIRGGKAFLTEVTRRMQERGYHYSYDAINQHVQKLRKARDTNGIVSAADPSAAGASKASATPRKAAATPRKRKTPAKKEIDEDDEDDDVKLKLEQAAEDDMMDSPSYRPSKRARPGASSFESFENGFGAPPNPDEI
ncbi:hypothetical protein HDV64DRAFT_240523 [Trichoderma sp. TUCIM 5745]